jgi:hypothetical protein
MTSVTSYESSIPTTADVEVRLATHVGTGEELTEHQQGLVKRWFVKLITGMKDMKWHCFHQVDDAISRELEPFFAEWLDTEMARKVLYGSFADYVCSWKDWIAIESLARRSLDYASRCQECSEESGLKILQHLQHQLADQLSRATITPEVSQNAENRGRGIENSVRTFLKLSDWMRQSGLRFRFDSYSESGSHQLRLLYQGMRIWDKKFGDAKTKNNDETSIDDARRGVFVLGNGETAVDVTFSGEARHFKTYQSTVARSGLLLRRIWIS